MRTVAFTVVALALIVCACAIYAVIADPMLLHGGTP